MKNCRLFFVLLMLFLFSGCGFRPLYAVESNEDVLEEASLIRVDPISGDGGYQMALNLKQKLNPKAISNPKKYVLKVKIHEPSFSDQSIRGDNFASLEKMTLPVDYQLIDMNTNQVLVSSSYQLSGSYNIIKEAYSTVMAKEKMYDNLIQSLSNEIALHMLAYLKGKELEN